MSDSVAERRAATLDFIAASIFSDRDEGIRLAASIVAEPAPQPPGQSAGRRPATDSRRPKVNQKKRFIILLSALLLIALAYYFISTDRTTDMVLIGTVDANQVIVSSKVVGRLETLNFDEGQNVKAGDLVATVDSAEYLAMRNAAQATLASLRTKIAESSATAASTQGDTTNQVANARATLRAAQATLKVAIANRDLQEADTRRTVALADQGVMSQQDRDRAVNSLRAQQAQVQTATDQVTAAEAALQAAIARTNQGTAAVHIVAETREQARNAQAQLAQAEVQLGYTKIFAPDQRQW